MSIVGPRPTLAYQVARYDDRQRRRLACRPGLTGLAQIRGRNALSWTERIDHDLEYVDTQSVGLDLRILVATVGVLATGAGVEGHAPDDPLSVEPPGTRPRRRRGPTTLRRIPDLRWATRHHPRRRARTCSCFAARTDHGASGGTHGNGSFTSAPGGLEHANLSPGQRLDGGAADGLRSRGRGLLAVQQRRHQHQRQCQRHGHHGRRHRRGRHLRDHDPARVRPQAGRPDQRGHRPGGHRQPDRGRAPSRTRASAGRPGSTRSCSTPAPCSPSGATRWAGSTAG